MDLLKFLGGNNSTVACTLSSFVSSLTNPLVNRNATGVVVANADGGAAAREFSHNTVFLNIYDITEANEVLYHAGIGVHHTGVEVYGMEFAFGRCESGPGVVQVTPKCTPPHIFREQLILGETPLAQEEVLRLLREFRENDRQWSGQAYHLIENNCNHFSEAFARRLLPVEVRAEQHARGTMELYDDGEREEVTLPDGRTVHVPVLMPRWINRLARNATRFLSPVLVERMNTMDRGSIG